MSNDESKLANVQAEDDASAEHGEPAPFTPKDEGKPDDAETGGNGLDDDQQAALEAKQVFEKLQRHAENRERKVTQSLSTFRKAFWDIQETLSWMAYRKPEEMNTPYRYGFLYPNTQGTPKLIIKEPCVDLLEVLQKKNSGLEGHLEDRKMERSEWGHVEAVNSPGRWPKARFDRDDVLRLWPPLSGVVEPALAASAATEAPTEPSRAEKLRAATVSLKKEDPGLDREIRSTDRKVLSHPFAEKLKAKFGGEIPSREWKLEWDFYKPAGKRGRGKSKPENKAGGKSH